MIIGILLLLSGLCLIFYSKTIYGLISLGFGLVYLYVTLHSIRKEQEEKEESENCSEEQQ